LSDIVGAKTVRLSDLKGKTIAIDAYNTLYMFLASIRTPDGSPLADFKGRPVSHLKGLLARTGRLAAEGVRPVYVFDGKPHRLKMRVLDERRERKEKAQAEYEEALEAGDLETARTKAQQTSKLTGEMVEQSTELLEALGIPWVQAPGEGEAQASALARDGKVWAASSQDFDSLLFGAPLLVRNLAFSGRRKLPGQRRYVTVEPEVIELGSVLEATGLTREGLVDMALLMGTDFNEGFRGIGPKTALKLIRKHGRLESVLEEKGLELPEADELRELFLDHPVSEVGELSWGPVDDRRVKELLCGEFGFGEEGVDKSLSDFSRHRAAVSQRSLDSWS
jgi:flap endonuclease-1